MEKKHFKTAVNAVLSGLLGASSAHAVAAAFGFGGGGAWVGALTAVCVCALSGFSLLAACGVGLAAAVTALFAGMPTITSFTPLTAGLVGAALTVVIYLMVRARGGIAPALTLWLGITLTACAAGDLSPRVALPGAVGALTLIAVSSELRYDKNIWRAVAAVTALAVLALCLTPGGYPTWSPLEAAANRIRDIANEYFHFTAERVPYTITTEGYNHTAYAADGETVVARLGGPAIPDDTPVMQVETDNDLYLRGSIRREYTGNNWEDNAPKTRYLYYDITRRAARTELFGMSGNDAFEAVEAEITFLRESTSTLFVPTRLESMDVSLKNALYYNSVGEMFLSRPVERDDSYSFRGYMPEEGTALQEAVMTASLRSDARYASVAAECLELPGGIESGVYELTLKVTADAQTPYEKAVAIAEWLRVNCAYTLTPDMPDDNRDFVSAFVLDTREGYCSYYASAMAIMCRIAGLPARYVEGYYVRANPLGVSVVTGLDAHAWTEVYFSGLGWVTFDATGGQSGPGEGSDGQKDKNGEDGVDKDPNAADSSPTDTPESPKDTPEPSADPDATATPAPTETPDPDNDLQTPPSELPDDPMTSPTPSPDGDLEAPPPEDPRDPTEPDTEDSDPPGKRSGVFIWLLLVLMILLTGGCVWFARRRLSAADPERLVTKSTPTDRAVAVYYRSILGVLTVMNIAQLPGEIPEVYARRAADSLEKPPQTLVPFLTAAAECAYSGSRAGRDIVRLGRNAYRNLVKRFTWKQRALWAWRRIREGLGSFEQIP